jgi:hypothetical protein
MDNPIIHLILHKVSLYFNLTKKLDKLLMGIHQTIFVNAKTHSTNLLNGFFDMC